MKKFLYLFLSLLVAGLVYSLCVTPAYANDETLHPVNIEWYYGDENDSGDLVNGVAGTKLGSVSLEIPNGTFDFTSYVDNPEGASFVKMYGVVPLIRINGNYYLCMSKYIEANSEYDDLNNTIEVDDSDNEINIKLFYMKVNVVQKQKLDKIRVSVDSSVNENLTSENHYEVYQIFHVTKSSDVQEDVTTDETVGQSITGEDTGFSYYITTSDEWYDVIANMTDWFELVPTVDEDTFIVKLADGVPAEESTAIAIAEYLEQFTEGKTSTDLVSGEARLDMDPGYYLIVSPINSNLILATTNIDITEKALYPFINKTVAEEDKNAAIGSEVHFTSVISIPKGSKAEMKITDTMTVGLTFIPDSLGVSPEVNYQFQETANGFEIVIAAEDLKALAAENSVELTLTYSAELNKKAIVAPRDDSTILGNINEITLEYVNFIQSASVDVDTTQLHLLKYDAEDESKTPIAGAKFQLLDENDELVPLYEVKPNEEYRLTDSSDSSSMTEFTTVKNKQIKIWGLDADITYKLRETKAPAGYNMLSEDVSVTPSSDLSLVVEIPNSSGMVLPSTGGIGTTIFYVIGGLLILGAAMFAFGLFLKRGFI